MQQGHEMSQQPRRKQARPRRRSGDSVGGCSSIDNKNGSTGLDSPPRKSPNHDDHRPPPPAENGTGQQPENLSLKRPSSSPAINLVSESALSF